MKKLALQESSTDVALSPSGWVRVYWETSPHKYWWQIFLTTPQYKQIIAREHTNSFVCKSSHEKSVYTSDGRVYFMHMFPKSLTLTITTEPTSVSSSDSSWREAWSSSRSNLSLHSWSTKPLTFLSNTIPSSVSSLLSESSTSESSTIQAACKINVTHIYYLAFACHHGHIETLEGYKDGRLETMQNNKKHGPDTRKCPEARSFFSAFSHDFYQRQPFLLPLATSNWQKKNEEKNERKEKEIKENRKKNNVMKTKYNL